MTAISSGLYVGGGNARCCTRVVWMPGTAILVSYIRLRPLSAAFSASLACVPLKPYWRCYRLRWFCSSISSIYGSAAFTWDEPSISGKSDDQEARSHRTVTFLRCRTILQHLAELALPFTGEAELRKLEIVHFKRYGFH
ncbi:hypothetical protein N7G274_000735 [Stereocaulon virgatum]|uniref:Uncharacterized protein n=1 Tax=Stereocaulon virgatum TaxID=373712 RepID=A0ABR4AW26_9LECA